MQGALPENELAASPATGRICVGAGDGPQTAGIEVEPLAGCQNGAVAPVLATSRRSTHFHHAFQQYHLHGLVLMTHLELRSHGTHGAGARVHGEGALRRMGHVELGATAYQPNVTVLPAVEHEKRSEEQTSETQ